MSRGLEERLASDCQRKYAYAFASGTLALTSALLTQSRVQKVLMPANTCFAVLSAIHLAGKQALMGDIELQRYQMTPASADSQLAEADAVIAVNGLGLMNTLRDWEQTCQARKQFLIEDACLSWGGSYQHKPAGHFGDVSILSFGYDKIIDAGGGGVLLTDRDDVAQQIADLLKNNTVFQMSEKQRQQIQHHLSRAPEANLQRQQNVGFLHRALKHPLIQKPVLETGDVCWRYSFLYQGDRDACLEAAHQQGLLMTKHYQSLHQLRTGPVLPRARIFSDHIVNVFIKSETPVSYLKQVVNFYEQYEEP